MTNQTTITNVSKVSFPKPAVQLVSVNEQTLVLFIRQALALTSVTVYYLGHLLPREVLCPLCPRVCVVKSIDEE